MNFLERSAALDHLLSRFQDAERAQGSLVFVSGEMGIGKTTLVDRFIAHIGDKARLVKVPFEGLSIPEPLGPFYGAARHFSSNIHQLLEGQAPRAQLFSALVEEVRAATKLTVLVTEDVHWADEASLDLLRYLGRRVENLRLLVIATLRDDELPPAHPLRRVVGDLATVSSVHRLMLPPLSVEAVSELARDSDLDPMELHAYTGGNPFYVSEVVASGSRVPMSLRDALLGRAARLSPQDREVLDVAATIGMLVDVDVLQQVAGRNIEDAVDQGLAVGLLRPTLHGIAFRHAAVQSILLTAISAARRQALHHRILSCLQNHPAFRHDVARLAFHAEEAKDHATFDYAVAAAERATAFQSHREAAEQYARALRWAGDLEPVARAEMLEAQAYSYYLTTRMTDAIAAQEAAAAIWQRVGRNLAYGNNLRRLSRFYLFATRHRDAIRLAEHAYVVLASFPDSREFALACGYLAEWRMRVNLIDEAVNLASRAMDIARRLDDEGTMAHALITNGTVRLGSGDETGIPDLERGLALARKLGNEEYTLRALTHLAEPPGFRRCGARSRAKYIAEGLAFAQKHGLDTKIVLFGGMNVRLLLDNTDWATVISEGENLVNNPAARGHYLLEIYVALALARLRCGEPASEDFDRAAELARQLGDARHMATVDAALVEAAWLKEDDTRAGVMALSGLERALASGNLSAASALALWAHRAGQTRCHYSWVVEPHALEIAGNCTGAAEMWDEDDVPLESMRARSASTDESDLRSVHADFGRIGAHPDALRVARRLRALGFGQVPRGPRPSTRATYGSLTRREVEILSVLSTGASNREIAQQFFLSPKTVDHHVSAILGKLGVTNRQQAVNHARDVGLIPK